MYAEYMTKAQLIKNLQEMDYQLGNLIAKLEKQSRKGSDVLYYSKNKGYGAFYKSDGKTRTYLSKDRHNEIADLANKTYQNKMLRAATEEKGQVERCLRTLESGKLLSDINDVFPSLHKAVQELVTPIEDTDEAYAREWYSRCSKIVANVKVLNPSLVTARGEVVKSKSEIIIADRLNALGIPYVYEYAFARTNDIRSRYPDFFILNKRTRKEYIWEHQGIMDKLEYCQESIDKLGIFLRRGYILGRNLIFTYECKDRPLSTVYVDALIKEYLI